MKKKFVCIISSALLVITFYLPVSGAITIEQTQIKSPDEEELISSKSNNLISLEANNVGYSNRYAVIVKGPSGSAYLYKCYTRDVQKGYNALHDNYSFPDEDIYILFTEESYPPDETFDPTIIDFESTETNLIDVLNMFKLGGENEMDYNDLLFLFWIDHGENDGGHTYFPLHEGTVWDYEFVQYAEGILGTTVFVFQPCASGGFVNEVSAPLRIVITSVNEWEGEGGWAGTFWKGLTGKADEDPEIGNQDGLVSFEEAYHLPARHVYENEGKHSLLDDNADSVGHHYLDGGYNISDPLKDAYTAARTFFSHRGLAAYANGPYFGLVDVELEFNGVPIGGVPPYDYYWDFGDGETSDEQNPEHIYTSPGIYDVVLTITDDEQDTANDTTYAWIQETNDPPIKPIIEGAANGKTGTSYDYTVMSTDPEGAILWYYIDWGDG